MNKNKLIKTVLCVLLIALIPCTYNTAKAKSVTKLSSYTMSLQEGQKKTIKIKKKKKKAKYTFKSTAKKFAKVNKKGVVTGVKKGVALIIVNEKYGWSNKCIGVLNVKVTKKKTPAKKPTATPKATTSPSAAPSQAPTTVPTSNATTTPAQTEAPVNTAVPTQTPIAYPDSHEAPSDFDAVKSGVSYGKATKISYASSVTGKNRNANVILPADYSSDKKYPVIYLLHGIGGNEDEWLDGKPANIIGNLTANDEAKEMIIVIPNIRAGADDSYPSNDPYSLEHFQKFDNFINDLRDCLMPYINDNYSTATGRENTAIAGLSMGGRESLYIGLNMLDTFGYVAAFSPGYGVFGYTANGVTEEGLFNEDTFTVPEKYRSNTFLMIINGIDEYSEECVGRVCGKTLTANGVNHWYYTTEGAHNFTTWKNGLYNFAKNIFK